MMDVSSIMDFQNVLFDSSITTKKVLFDKLSESLLRSGYITDKSKFIDDLEKREQEMETGIEDGIGIPHAKSQYVVEATVAFAHTGIMKDYYALDDTPIECVFMLAIPEKSNDLHLDILSSLSRKLMDDTFKKDIKNAKTKAELKKILENIGG